MAAPRVRDAMWPVEDIVHEDDSLAGAIELMRGKALSSLPVRRADGRLDGTLVIRDAVAVAEQGGDGVTVGSVARSDAAVPADLDLDGALRMVRSQHVNRLPVTNGETLQGMVSQGDIRAAAMLAEMGVRVARVSRVVSPLDRMREKGAAGYLLGGALALQVIQEALGDRRADLRRILDFGCGHGRVMRVLRAAYPDAEIVACDIDEDCVSFCAATFEALPVQASADPRSIAVEPGFDLIWSGSVLTHLDPRVWQPLLGRLGELVAPAGHLIATVNGPTTAEQLTEQGKWKGELTPDENMRLVAAYRANGAGYRDYPGQKGYGLSLCSPDVVEQIAGESGLRVARIMPGAWGLGRPGQDVVVLLPASRG